jgi:SAM-dependent methyltransferase
MKLRLKAIATGLVTYVPGVSHLRPTGGTGSARYCYAVWLRHLILAHDAGLYAAVPRVVAELGPGDSIGIGLAALLSGAEKYYALDLVAYSDLKGNLNVFEELADLFKMRAPIPGDEEFPGVFPKLPGYEFPHSLLPAALMEHVLSQDRLRRIRTSIQAPGGEGSCIVYQAPWSDRGVIQDRSVDLIYSQAVLEHVDDLQNVYHTMRRWLKPGGAMSHQIDFQSHGKADVWNGQWTYSDVAWKLVVGRRAYLLNRVPRSEHLRLLRECGFTIVRETVTRASSTLRRTDLASRFRGLSDEDLTSSGTFILALAPAT